MVFRIVLLLTLLLFATGVVFQIASPAPPSSPKTTFTPSISPSSNENRTQKAYVMRVIDGDTVEVLTDGQIQKIRYIGIDTPETVDPRKPVQCFGREASLKNKELVEGKEIKIEKDVSETDTFGRLLRYVYVGDPSPSTDGSGQVFVNEELVRQGYAHAATFPPDVKYQELFREAQKEAQSENRGLWSTCR